MTDEFKIPRGQEKDHVDLNTMTFFDMFSGDDIDDLTSVKTNLVLLQVEYKDVIRKINRSGFFLSILYLITIVYLAIFFATVNVCW